MIKIGLFLGGVICSALAQILVKSGMSQPSDSFIQSITSWSVIVAILLYILSFISYAAFLKTTELTVASPLFVGGVVLLIFLYGFTMGEGISLVRSLGAILIVSGIFLVQFSAG